MTGSATEAVRWREGKEAGGHAVAGLAKPGFEAVREAFIYDVRACKGATV
jgi:hypothetical protein